MVRTGRTRYDPPRFMTVNQAVAQLLEVEERRKEGVCGPDTVAIGLARVGQETQCIVSGTLAELLRVDFGPPLHSLVLAAPGHMHELEEVMVKRFRYKDGVTPLLPPPAPAKKPGDSDSDNEGASAAAGGAGDAAP